MIAIGLAAGALLLATPAGAVAWASSTSPLVVSDNGNTLGKAYGTFVNSGNVYARTNSNYKDSSTGNGHSVYVTTDYAFKDPITGFYFTSYNNVETPRTASGSYIAKYTQKPLDSWAEYARGHTNICEDQSFSGDPCSVQAHPTFNY
jgi:hypothetical protein